MCTGRGREEHCDNIDDPGNSKVDPAKRSRRRPWSFLRGLGPIEIFTAILAISTAIQVWAFIESERSSLAPTAMQTVPNPLSAGHLIFRYELKNSGKETALLQESIATVTLNVRLPDYPYFGQASASRKARLLPGQGVYLEFMPYLDGRPFVLSDEQIRRINDGYFGLWVYGRIKYRDRFSMLFGTETIGYCFRYNPHGVAVVGMFDACSEEHYTYVD